MQGPGPQPGRSSYLNFDLLIEQGRDREYPVFVLHSPAGEARATMHFPFDELDLENRLGKLQIALLRSGGRQRRRLPSEEEQAVQDFGRALFDALFSGDVRTCYDMSLREAAEQEKGLRLKLRIRPSELSALPWEFLYDPDQAEYLCLSRQTPIVRYLESPRLIRPLTVSPPLRILGMAASPLDLPGLDIEHERHRVGQAFQGLQEQRLVELEWLPGQTARDLQAAMWDGPWHVFHFIGHGGFDAQADEGFLALADGDGYTSHLTASRLGRLLADHATLRLVLLDACEGARGRERDIYSSTAASLVQQGIPAVVAMQYEISDQAAIEFARAFYRALAYGMAVDEAVVGARKAIDLALTNTVEWGTPMLYMRTPDGVLFDLKEAPAPAPEAAMPKAPGMATGLRPNPYVGPRAFQQGETLYGRDREAKELLDLLIAEHSVLLYSPSGAGKASLIQAALVPALEGEGFRVWPTMRVNLELPPGELSDRSPNRYVLSLLLSLEKALPQDARTPIPELAGMTLDDYLGQHAEDGGEARGDVFVFDQFEEILIIDPTDRDVKLEFFEQLGVMLQNRRRWALFAMREEFIAGLDPYRASIPGRFSAIYRLELMNTQAALAAIQEPARRAGVDFTDAAAHILVDDLRRVTVQMPDGTAEQRLSDSVEPVQLQVVCRWLWETLPEGATRITEADILAMGDVDSALASYYANQVSTVAADTGVPERAIREWFASQLITGQGIRGQVLQGTEKSQGLANRAIWPLVYAHLVRAERRRGATWFELAHDRLIEPIRADNATWGRGRLRTAYSLGLDVGGQMQVLIPRGSAVPFLSEPFLATTVQDAQEFIEFQIYMGEQTLTRENVLLGAIHIDLSPQPAGLARFEIRFQLEQSGLLRVSATDLNSGRLYDHELELPPGFFGEATELAWESRPQEFDGLLEALQQNAPPSGLRGLLGRGQRQERAEQREIIAEQLGRLGDVRAVDPLIAQLQDPEPGPRRAAAEALGQLGDDRAVEPLITALQDQDRGVRQRAARALGELGDSGAVEPLIAALGDEDWPVRQGAAVALGKLGDPRALEPLFAALNDKDHLVHQVAAMALGKLGEPAVEPLIAALRDQDDGVRQKAAQALGELGDPRAVEPLIASLRDETWSVRHEAAQALGQLGDSRAVEPLIAALGDEDWPLRQGAAEALGELGDPRAVEPLIVALQDNESRVRLAAAEALARLGDSRATLPLISVLQDESIEARGAAAQALGQLGDARAVEPLIAALLDEEQGAWPRQQAAEALGKLGDTRAVEPLVAALTLPSEWAYTRMGAVRALGQLGDDRAVEPLVTALRDETDDAIREEIVTSLGLLRDVRAVEPLITALQDAKSDIRVAAAQALGQISDPRARPALQDAATEDANPEVRTTAARALEQLQPYLSPHPIFAGQYEIVEELDPGGLTDKYRVRTVSSGQEARLTVVRDPPDTPDFADRFAEEAATWAGLQHPGLVRILDHGLEAGRPYLVRERVGEERTLQDLLAEQGPLSPEQALPILAQVADALDYLHGQDPPLLYLHLKPSHLLLEGEGEGLRAMLSDSVTTRAWQAISEDLVATPGYVSPEQASGAPASPRSDVYELGLLAYEILAGRSPFERDTPLALMRAHAEEPPPPPREFVPKLGDDVSAVVLKALAKEPEERYAGAGEFVAALRKAEQPEEPGLTDLKVDPRVESLLTLDLQGDVYKLQDVIWMDVTESKNLHHIFVDIVDEQGQRLVGEQIRVSWADGETILVTEEKPGEPWSANFSMFATMGSYTVSVVAATGASDAVAGLGMGTPEEPHVKHHTSFGLRFVQRPPPEEPAGEPTLASRTVRVGLHGRNAELFREVDYQAIRQANIEVVKMMSQTRPEVFARLKRENPDIEIITRLYDDRMGPQGHPAPQEFADRMIPIIKTLRPYCTKYEVHNEPNHRERIEGWGPNDEDAQSFNEWFLAVYNLLKSECPWASLGFPGLAIPSFMHRDRAWLRICKPAIRRADWLGVHCYWQTPPDGPGQIFDPQFGLAFLHYHQEYPQKTLQILECGNSNVHDPNYDISEEEIAQEYVRWLKEVFKYDYIHSASFYVLSSPDPQWDVFAWVTEAGEIRSVVEAVGKMERPPLVEPEVPIAEAFILPAHFTELEVSLFRARYPAETAARVSGPLGEAQETIPLDVDAPELARALEALRQDDATEADAEAAGRWLFENLFSGSLTRILGSSLDAARAQGEGLRLRFLAEQADLAALPWELLHDGRTFLAFQRDITFVRGLRSVTAPPPSEIAGPLRVLFVGASPDDQAPIDLDASLAALRAGLSGLTASGLATVTELRHPTRSDLARALGESYHIIVYEGHSLFDEEASTGFLALEDESGRTDPLGAEEVVSLLQGQDLRLVVLNTSESAFGRRGANYFDLAQVASGVALPAIVAMQLPVSDEAAIAFNGSFYASLAAGYPLDVAVAEGRRAIAEAMPREDLAVSWASWAAPVVFSQSPIPILQPSLRFWFITANPAQYNWGRAFEAGSEEWTQVRGAEAQQNLRQARPGDVVLAYRSGPDRYFTGLGHIAGEPYPFQNRHAVRIDMDLKLDTGLTLDEMRQEVPDLQHVTRTRPISFSPVTIQQWAAIRDLILAHNPGLGPNDLPPWHRIEIEQVDLPAETASGAKESVTLSLRNRGNLAWRTGDRLMVTSRWQLARDVERTPTQLLAAVTIDPDDPPIRALRTLLLEAFSPEDLRLFCQERARFRPVLSRIGPGPSLMEIVDVLFELCRTELLWDELMVGLVQSRPEQVARYADQLPAPVERVIQIDRDVPPGGILELKDIELQAPQAPGRYEVRWTVEGQGWERQAEPTTATRHLEVPPEFAKARPHLLVRQAGGINLRLLPQRDSELVAQVPDGTLLEVRGDLERALANIGQAGEAIYVQAPDGTIGYVDAGSVVQRGAPRLEYERQYVLLPPGSDLEWALAVVDATWEDQKLTFGTSLDDAGIGAVAGRHVYAVNPEQWPEDPVDLIGQFYPGVELAQLTLQTPDELRERLPQISGTVSFGLPSSLEARDRAYTTLPREQYRRTYLLLPPGAEAEWARAAVRATWGRDPVTIGSSADDAGIGDLDVRQVLAINPGAWGDVPLGTFYEQNYPGVELVEVQADRAEELAYRLEEVGAGYWPTTHTLERLSTAAQAALRWAEGFRQKAGAQVIYTEYLLAGLYRRESTTTHRLLAQFHDEATIEDRLERLVNRETATSLRLVDVEPPQALPEPIALSPNSKMALLRGALVADGQGSERIRARHLLAGMLAVSGSEAARWLVDKVGLPAGQLYDLVALAGEEEPAASLVTAIDEALRRAGEVSVWIVATAGDDDEQLAQLDALTADETTTWGANRHIRQGDMVLLYRTAPFSDIKYVFRAASAAVEAAPTPATPWAVTCQMEAKVTLDTPVTLEDLRATIGQENWEPLGNPQSWNEHPTDAKAEGVWPSLRDLILLRAPAQRPDLMDRFPDDWPQVAIEDWFLSLDAPPEAELRIGQECTFVLSFKAFEEPRSRLLRVPHNVRDLALFVDAPAFGLVGKREHSITFRNGNPEKHQRSLEFKLVPLISGRHTVTVLAYRDTGHARLRLVDVPSRPVQVVAHEKTIDIPALIDPRAIPEPRPDVMLYVALEETLQGQQTVIYAHCPALNWSRVRAATLPWGASDLAAMRRTAIEVAAAASECPPAHGLASLRNLGATIYDQLMPPGSDLREFYRQVSAAARTSHRPLRWLVVADQGALLPWELAAPYDPDGADDFMGASFVLAHWVGLQDLSLSSRAPLHLLDLTHYHRLVTPELERWQAVLGGSELVKLERESGRLALMEPGSPYYGLHVLRYTERHATSDIVSATVQGTQPASAQNETVDLLSQRRRLDFKKRQPVFGLSLVKGQPLDPGCNQCDSRLEREWIVPLIHAGATALVGPRWPVSREADQVFYHAFYAAMRHGVLLGEAVRRARSQVRFAFPHRSDWLAYAYFGHPDCKPYLVEPSEGFAVIEVCDYPQDASLEAGKTYEFRASYLAEAPSWYDGRRHIERPWLVLKEPSVKATVLDTGESRLVRLEPLANGAGYEQYLKLTMPSYATTLPVIARFQSEGRELETLILNLDVVEEA